MFVHPIVTALHHALEHPIVVLVGVPGSGKSFVASFANDTHVILDAADDDHVAAQIAESKETRWLVTTPKRLEIDGAHYVYMTLLGDDDAFLFLESELRRFQIVEREDDLRTLAPLLSGLPSAIKEAVRLVEMIGAKRLIEKIEADGLFSVLSGHDAKKTWDVLPVDSQHLLATCALFESFNADDLYDAFQIRLIDERHRNAFAILIEYDLLRRGSGAVFQVSEYGRLLVSEFAAPNDTTVDRLVQWAIERGRAGALERFLGRPRAETHPEYTNAIAALLDAERVVLQSQLSTALLNPSRKGFAVCANVAGFRCIASGRLAEAKNILGSIPSGLNERDEIAALEFEANIAKAEERFDDAIKHLERALEFTMPPKIRHRIMNNHVALLWESGDRVSARNEATKMCEETEGISRLAATSNLGVMLQNDGMSERAEEVMHDALELAGRLDNDRYAAIVTFDLGTLALERGRFRRATQLLGDATDALHQVQETRLADLSTAANTVARFALGLPTTVDLDQLARHLSDSGDTLFSDAIRLYERVLNAIGTPAPTTPRVTVREHGPDEVQVPIRLLNRLPNVASLFVDLASTSFVINDESFYLAPDSSPQKIFAALVHERLNDERPLTVQELFFAGWPGENIGAKAAKNRVHVALSTLRSAGLKAHIETTDDGYRVSESTWVICRNPEVSGT